MNSKLTLKLNEDVIGKAKTYAKSKHTSLSSLIENYLQRLTSENESEEKITPLVKSLSGIVKLPKEYDHKRDYTNHLLEKYK